jgi:hypothetical protein
MSTAYHRDSTLRSRVDKPHRAQPTVQTAATNGYASLFGRFAFILLLWQPAALVKTAARLCNMPTLLMSVPGAIDVTLHTGSLRRPTLF